MQSIGVRGLFDRELLAANFDDISNAQLSASSGFDLAVHFDFAALDFQLGLPARSREVDQFQEMIETKRIGF